MNLSTFILLSLGIGVVFGTVLNTTFPEYIAIINQNILSPIGESFLRLIQFVVVPIVFSSLIMGLTRIKGAGQVGRYTVKLMTSYVLTSSIALCVGMGTAYFLQPGSGVSGFTVSTEIK
jgi:proton glutamate symport protein